MLLIRQSDSVAPCMQLIGYEGGTPLLPVDTPRGPLFTKGMPWILLIHK